MSLDDRVNAQEEKHMTDDEIHDCFQQRSKDKTQERRLIANAIEEKLLYTKFEWQGLTDAEIEEFENMKLGTHDLCLEIEAKLQEKNT